MIKKVFILLTLAGVFSCGVKGPPFPPEDTETQELKQNQANSDKDIKKDKNTKKQIKK